MKWPSLVLGCFYLQMKKNKKTSGTFKSNSLYMIMNSDQNLYINFNSYLSISLSKCFHITNYLSLHKTFGHSKVVSLRYFGVIFLLWSRYFFFCEPRLWSLFCLKVFFLWILYYFFSWVYLVWGGFFSFILVFISSLIQSIKYTYMRKH